MIILTYEEQAIIKMYHFESKEELIDYILEKVSELSDEIDVEGAISENPTNPENTQ